MKTFARESYIVFWRQMRMNLRNPAWIIIGMLQPVMYVVLFGPLLEPLIDQFGATNAYTFFIPGMLVQLGIFGAFQPVLYVLLFGPLLEPLIDQFGATNAYTFFIPGMLVQLGIFGAFFAGFSLIGEWREGVVEAERVTPAARSSLLVGRLMRDELQLLVQALILVALGYLLGMDASIGGMVLGVVLTLLIGGACAASSNAFALTVKSEDVMAPVINMVMMPVLLLSGILLPMTIGPGWLERASDFMPIRHVVDAVRGAFGGDYSSMF